MNVRLEKLEKKVGQMYSFDSILGESKVLKEAVSLAQKVSVTDVPVLLTGETGTGKEVFAQAIHYSSKPVSYTHLVTNDLSAIQSSCLFIKSDFNAHRHGIRIVTGMGSGMNGRRHIVYLFLTQTLAG